MSTRPTPELSILHELASFAESVAARARPLVDDVEVLVTRRDLVSFGIENRTLSPEIKLGRLQVGLRALKNGRLAMAATTSFTVEENLSALKASLAGGRETPLAEFGAWRAAPCAPTFDEGLARFTREPRALQQLAVDVRDRAFAAAAGAPHVEGIEGGVRATTRWVALATGRGLAAFLDHVLVAYAEVNSARTEREVVRAWPQDDAFVRDVGARAVRAYPARRLAPRDLGVGAATRLPVLLEPSVVESLFRYPAHDHFLASALVAGQTRLEPGLLIADERVRLVDVGPAAPLGQPFDDELTPKRETVLIERGRFGSFVTSRVSAKRAGLAETGNGHRHPILAEELSEAPVRDKLSGLAMDAGERPFATLLATIERGILVRSLLGIHGADRARTAFSATVADGLAIEGGQVVGHLAPGAWNLSARVLPGDGEEGLLAHAEPSRERLDTGGALLPWLLTTATAG